MAKELSKTYEGRINYPLSAICGQEKLKLSLLLNVINPQIGGALIRGERGSAKTIAVRGLSDILPEIEVVQGCRFSCDPKNISKMCSLCREEYEKGKKLPVSKRRMRIVELPVGTTEDRVVGTLNIEKAITEGVKALEIGMLAEANRGILYVDNINLLDDHIMDVLLDSAAMGVNVVEREGVSVSHPANFILIGSMNPEEGELRPQLHDRLAFHVEVKGIGSLQGRLKVMKQAMEFERDSIYFRGLYEESSNEIARKILQAQKLLPQVTIKEEFLRIVARMGIELDVDGHRPDIIITRAAMTKAAHDGRKKVTEDDMIFASELTLGFRMRRTPFEEAALGTTRFQQVLEHAKKLEAEEKKKKRKAKAQKAKSKAKKTTTSKKTKKSVSKKKTSS
ncbi:MAG: ATP-binding protein [Deltaproteobacteria bacterium]|nr:ATP-binding protein [Deltaproteobacteria bacterium]